MVFLLILAFVFIYGGWLIGKSIGRFLGDNNERTFIDKSVHHHYHTTINDNKTISVIDEETKKKVFEFRESKENESK